MRTTCIYNELFSVCIRAMLSMENRHVRTYRHMSKWHIAVTATHHLDTICTCLFLHYASTLRSILDEKFKYQETKCMKICPLCPTRHIRRVYFLFPPSIDPLSDSCIQIIPQKATLVSKKIRNVSFPSRFCPLFMDVI